VPGSGGASQAELCGAEFHEWLGPWLIPATIAALIVLTVVVAVPLVLLWRKAGRPRRADRP
jgi:hypothetical protein